MTWLRWDVETPRSDVVGHLAHELNIQPAQALGHYVACCLGFGEFRPEGMASATTDTQLEEWALWRGKRGKFAKAFRARCISTGFNEDGSESRDPKGRIRGWWRQLALLDKQRRDNSRPGAPRRNPPENPPKTRAGIARESRGDSAGNEDVDGNDNRPSSSSAGARARAPGPDYAITCTVAANEGLRENPRIGKAFNELVSANQMDVTESWRAAGVPADLAARVIRERARAYTPSATRRQPTTLRYFDSAVQEAFDKERQGSQPRPAAKRLPRVTA